MKNYVVYTAFLSMSQICGIFLGEVLVGESHGLDCTGGGYKWLYHTFAGEAFIFMVMINLIMQGFLIENVLYDVPYDQGDFEKENDDFKAVRIIERNY